MREPAWAADTPDRPRVAYLVHDLGDAAVRRRADLIRAGGAEPVIAGFFRGATAPAHIGDTRPVILGMTRDGALMARVLSVLRHILRPARIQQAIRGAPVILARNLEMLVLAAVLRKQGQRLVYECLDIHRLLLGNGPASRILHAIEAMAMRHVDLVVVSAPAFRDAYFRHRRHWAGPIELVENQVQSSTAELPPPSHVPNGPPWQIGWFGMLRCRRTLDLLKSLVAHSEGRIEVVIAGKPSLDIFPDLPGELDGLDGLRFVGSYTAADLPVLYGQVHFAWAIDFFEEGLNSAWLLPNRLYESIAYGAVPIAFSGIATGTWLSKHGAGVRVQDPESDLLPLLSTPTLPDYAQLREACAQVPRAAVLMDAERQRAIALKILGAA
ncbi:hypothetical protein WSK_3574 [Novosphingobium sp. Rr 2-17]|uniref:hypothetical protein n=1 Tax=Novosphingobium sp. Rr 2-17 TaxID=555793 RepID=UPI000269A86B|nr:hypothetical protein [Novosphingobium sp. Rr 2-17]EIZ77903.1 hypothetical protein WSK_3574 [Novosphingobium sp. Rr 2-17]